MRPDRIDCLPDDMVNAAGGNLLLRREIDDEAVMRANRVVVDSIEQAKLEAGEFVGDRDWGGGAEGAAEVERC